MASSCHRGGLPLDPGGATKMTLSFLRNTVWKGQPSPVGGQVGTQEPNFLKSWPREKYYLATGWGSFWAVTRQPQFKQAYTKIAKPTWKSTARSSTIEPWHFWQTRMKPTSRLRTKDWWIFHIHAQQKWLDNFSSSPTGTSRIREKPHDGSS